MYIDHNVINMKFAKGATQCSELAQKFASKKEKSHGKFGKCQICQLKASFIVLFYFSANTANCQIMPFANFILFKFASN